MNVFGNRTAVFYDNGGRCVYEIQADGTVIDTSFRVIGRFRGRAYYNLTGEYLGRVTEAGTVVDWQGLVIGSIAANGVVTDTLQHVEGRFRGKS